MLKAQGLLPAGRTVMAGNGPLLLAAGGADPARRRKDRGDRRHHGTRANWLRALLHLPDFLLSPYFGKGLALLREVRAKAPVVRADRIDAIGTDRLREVRTSTAVASRPICCCCTRAWCRTSISRSPPAWRIAGTNDSSASSRCSIRISAVRCRASRWRATARASPAVRRRPSAAGSPPSRRCARSSPKPIARSADRAAASAARGDGARLPRLAQSPGGSLRQPEGDTIVCRCEEVTAKQIRETARHRLRGAQSDEGLPALRHGAVPGQAVRPHGDRADRRGSATRRRSRSATTACAHR